MSTFGKTLFSGTRFIFWVLGPALLKFALGMLTFGLARDDSSFASLALTTIAAATSLLLFLGLYDPVRFQWALRCVTAVVFLAYLGYMIEMLLCEKGCIASPGDRSETSPIKVLFAFPIIGLPSLWYTLTGRFAIGGRREGADNHQLEGDDK
jgi:hypothetical protein